MPDEYGDVSRKMRFDDAKDNFFAAARYGLKPQLVWVDGRTHSVSELVNAQLLGLASNGLKQAGVDSSDIDKYLGVIHERVEAGQTGSQWMLSAVPSLGNELSSETRDRAIVAAALDRQKSGCPVHQWTPLSSTEKQSMTDLRETVGEIMSTDLFTVSPDDPITLAASLMDWRHIRHLPVEHDGHLVGLISSRELFHFIAITAPVSRDPKTVLIREVMSRDPVTVTRHTRIYEALKLMLESQTDCLPVTNGNDLIGIVTSQDMLQVFADTLKQQVGKQSGARAGAAG